MTLTQCEVRQNTCRKDEIREVKTVLSIHPLNVGHQTNYDNQRSNNQCVRLLNHSCTRPKDMEVQGVEQINNNQEFITFLRTILMILENHNFKETVKTFKNECNELGYNEIDPPHSPIRDTKSSPKIIFENFSKTEPCRIIIENCSEEENNNSNNLKNIPSNIPVYTKKHKTNEKLKDKHHEIMESNENESEENNEKQQEIIQVTIPNITNESNYIDNNNKEIEQSIMLLNIENEITQKEDAYIETNELKTNSKTSTPDSKRSNKLAKYKSDDYDALKNKFSILQVEHQKLMDVVTELTFALQTSIKGQIEDTHVILNNCEKIYPELFCNKPMKSNIALIPKNVNQGEIVPGTEIKSNCEFVNNDLKMAHDPVYKTCFNLDFQKVKHDLKNGELNTKLLLLQALRWRITKTPDIVRDHIIRTYIRYDILNVHCCSHRSGITYPKNSIVFTSFYCSCKSPQALQQAVARFVNAFASVKLGRDYIIHQSVILNILLSIMLGTHPSTPQIDDVTRDMMIATLQKISLRYSARMIMITDGLTEYISKYLLTNYLTLSDYCLEYSIALLRNLWLHSESREKCQPIASEIVKLLANLLDEQYLFCLPYITGSLYNLLPDSYFHKAAKAINLEQIILYKIEKLEGEMKEQLQYILEIYLNPDQWQPLCECDLVTDSENEMDIIEPEIDLNEDINYTNANGEQFLFGYRRTYSIDGAEINPNYINNIFSIPVTPNLSNLTAKCIPSKQIPEIEYLEYAAQFLNEKMNKKILSITNETQYKEVQTEENVFYDEVKDEETVSKKEIEMTFCEDTQQLYIVPSKNGIFEPEKTLRTFSPSFLKNIGEYDIKNISKSVPVSPRNKNIDKPPEENPKSVAQFLTPTANFSGICYREGFKPRSFSDSSTPHIGFCDEGTKNNNKYAYSKYSCACFVEMKRSFEEENKKKNNNEKVNNLSIKNDISENVISSNYCKYKCYPTSNSAPLHAAPKKERDTGTSKSLDENDYTSVFESRPRILRTP